MPELQPVKPYTQHPKAHATHLNGRAQAPKAPVPHAEQPEAYSGLAAAHTARGPLQQPLQASLQQATSHEQQQRHGVMMSSAYPQTDPKHAQADPLQLQHPSQNAPPGSSLQSAQTALPQKPLKGKSVKAPAPAAGAMLSEEVLQQVCAAAKIGQKETLLIALLQCKPCKNQVGMHLVHVLRSLHHMPFSSFETLSAADLLQQQQTVVGLHDVVAMVTAHVMLLFMLHIVVRFLLELGFAYVANSTHCWSSGS